MKCIEYVDSLKNNWPLIAVCCSFVLTMAFFWLFVTQLLSLKWGKAVLCFSLMIGCIAICLYSKEKLDNK